MQPLAIPEDRGMVVPAGSIVRTAYVPIDAIGLASRDRMDVGAVERAMQRRMGIAPAQPWPCPVGRWDGDRFVVHDGRHDCVGALMLGVEHLLVAWVEDGQAA